MDFNYFDLVIAAIVLLLGLKGLINGFFKELFGLVGIIGGIFVASRVGTQVGEFLNENIFHFESHSAVSFAGFLLTLVAFWLGMVVLGHLFKKLGSLSGLGAIDRIAGFVLGSGKFFLIAAVIAYAVNNIKTIHDNIEEPMKNSVLFPILVETGGYIMHLDPAELKEKTDAVIEKSSDAIGDFAHDHADDIAEHVKKTLTD